MKETALTDSLARKRKGDCGKGGQGDLEAWISRNPFFQTLNLANERCRACPLERNGASNYEPRLKSKRSH